MGKPKAEKPMTEQRALGLALKALRNRAGLTQEEAAERASIVVSTWRRYEWGHRDLSLEKVMRVARAIGADEDTLLIERSRIMGPTLVRSSKTPEAPRDQKPASLEVPVWGRVRQGAKAAMAYDVGEPLDTLDLGWMFGPDAGFLRVAGDSETGYVESGQYVIYNRRSWPRRGEGCVVETHAGEMYIKEFVRQEGQQLVVAQRFPQEELTFDLEHEVKGVYRVVLRGG